MRIQLPPRGQAAPRVRPRAPRPACARPEERSRRTQEKILAAAERLLRRQLMDELTITAIAREAGFAVGSFYSRFESKDALVPAIGERYARRFDEVFEALLDPRDWESLDLAGRVRRLVRLALRTYLRNRGIIRALHLQWRTEPHNVVTEGLRERRGKFDARLVGVLVPARAEIRHPDPDQAALFATKLLGATLRDVLLVPADHPHAYTGLDERGLARELTRSLLAYLTFEPAPQC